MSRNVLIKCLVFASPFQSDSAIDYLNVVYLFFCLSVVLLIFVFVCLKDRQTYVVKQAFNEVKINP